MNAITSVKIPGVKKMYSGKVRDLYRVDDGHMLIVSTDRVSAFDFVFPNGIPGKGRILNQVSNLWFKNIKFIKNHIVETDYKNFPKPFCDFPELLEGRSVLVKKTTRIDFECVARGYIIGTGWNDYKKTGSICGIKLRPGLMMAEKLDDPLFTPATKEDKGHDINVSIDVMRNAMGEAVADHIGDTTLRIYEFARDILDRIGIILADTKIEFGFYNNEIILIDEILTPDSSRFWDKDAYRVDESPLSFDKQFIRDYLNTTTWDKNSPPPPLPDEIVDKTLIKYEEIRDRISSLFQN
ncbi:MAG: phosphoribosylaminoimidazolesuccinocarboxamide synthase [Spirochaetes bacterium]|jgi:phosphoribosylaminoimidazole-succinocarboxamide synthase|nr:phosphoribosylaminoimidazolesuccinocarboxamide synthase [Spirochaetota bacterium]